MFKNRQKELLNDILFVFILFVFTLVVLCLFNTSDLILRSNLENIFLILLMTIGIFYGYVSDNAVKSFLIGFFLWPIFLIFTIIQDSSPVEEIMKSIVENPLNFIIMFFIFILWGLPGYFISQSKSDGKNKRLYIIASVLFFIITGVVFVIINLD